MSKKSYNPFKMWGAWLGFGLLLSWWIIVPGVSISTKMLTFQTSGDWGLLASSLLIYGSLISGFLIGWGIHSSIRAIRN